MFEVTYRTLFGGTVVSLGGYRSLSGVTEVCSRGNRRVFKELQKFVRRIAEVRLEVIEVYSGATEVCSRVTEVCSRVVEDCSGVTEVCSRVTEFARKAT